MVFFHFSNIYRLSLLRDNFYLFINMLMFTFPQILLLWTALFMLVFGLPALFAPKTFKSVLEKFLKNTELMRIRWFIVMILWFFYLMVYQAFNNGRAMFFSIFGYASLLKWIVLMRWPSWANIKYKRYYSSTLGSILMGSICVLFAAFMAWIALVKI